MSVAIVAMVNHTALEAQIVDKKDVYSDCPVATESANNVTIVSNIELTCFLFNFPIKSNTVYSAACR